MERKFVVYMHIFPNNKRYIGITCQDIKDRWKNGTGYGSDQPLIYNAIKKYGWENVKHIILFKDLTEEQAKKEEKKLIEQYNTFDDRYGYNMTLGGDGFLKYATEEEKEEVYQKRVEKAREYYQENKEKCKVRQKRYINNNHEKINQSKREYYRKNKEKIIQYHKKYYQENKDIINQKNKQYVEKNKEKTKEYQKKYREEHKEELKEYFKKRYRDKKKKGSESNGSNAKSL